MKLGIASKSAKKYWKEVKWINRIRNQIVIREGLRKRAGKNWENLQHQAMKPST